MNATDVPDVLDEGRESLLSLPAGWLWVPLGEIAEVRMGNSPPGSSYNEAGRGLPLINGPSEFGAGALDHPTPRQFTEEYSRTCAPGDLLICVRGSTTGRTNIATFEAAIGRGVASIRAFELQPYVNHYIWSRAAAILSMASGSTFPNISLAQLRALAIPLPPLEEQARIVESLEKAMADINAGIDRLAHARADLALFRSALLRAAMSGELTAQYRAGAKEMGSDLTDGKGPPAMRSVAQGVLFDPTAEAADRVLEDLPSGWRWASFGSVCDVRLGRSKSPSNRADKFATPYLRAANIGEEGLLLDDVMLMDFPPREQDVYRLRAGDLVVAEASGSASQVGKPALWQEELPLCCYQNTVIRLRPFAMLPAFVLTALQHCYFNGVFSGLSAGVGINHLGASRLSAISIPMPPADEQQRIADEVAAQLEAMVASRRTIDRTLDQAEQLRRSVWKKAFSGGLVASSVDPTAVGSLLSAVQSRLRARSAAESETQSTRTRPRRKEPIVRRPLQEVLRDHPDGLSPERLFVLGGYKPDEVDEFYAELALFSEDVAEDRPSEDDLLQWPKSGEIILRLKES